MAPSVGEFRPDDPLTPSELAIVLASLGARVSAPDPDRPVTIRELDAQLVTAVGLRTEARGLRLAAVYAGLAPGPWLGTETVARLLGLRVNHLKDQEQLELQLAQPATRAEAAYSIARLLELDLEEIDATSRETVESFALPALDALAADGPRARAPLRRLAVRLGGDLRAAAAARSAGCCPAASTARASSGASTSSSRSRAPRRSRPCSRAGRRTT